jgi:ubiquinone/menaquinone biosynthesis C-methylase UbiE
VADLTPSTQIYWNAAAQTYEQDFAGTLIGQIQREAVWRELERVFRPGQRVLELNCGTGIDALHLAKRGVRILACDIAPGMIDLARERVATARVCEAVDFRVLATEDLPNLEPEGPFDGAYSNFSGLNCVEDLPAVARNLHRLLAPGAPLLVCMIGKFVPWEIAWFLAHRDVSKALRRLRRGVVRSVEGGTLKVQYPPVREIVRVFAPCFKLRKWRGIGIVVPPSYMESWACRFPRVTRALAAMDKRLGGLPVLRSMADCVLLEMTRNRAMDEE